MPERKNDDQVAVNDDKYEGNHRGTSTGRGDEEKAATNDVSPSIEDGVGDDAKT